MEISFHYARDRQYYAIRFDAGPFETVPFLRELRFWGVDRFPCPRLSTVAALLALRDHPMDSATLSNAELNAPVCAAISEHFGIEIHPSKYNTERRDLAGGDLLIAPSRFTAPRDPRTFIDGGEVLTWISLDDIGGPLGGLVRTNIDAFDLDAMTKNLVVALCCAGKEVGHIVLEGAAPELGQLMHWIGLELIDPADV